MNIIIAGDGEMGFYLAKMFSEGNHDITVVDPHKELLKLIESQIDILTITGDSCSIEILQRANVSKADLLIAVLHEEKINIFTAILAKRLGAKRVIARINSTEYLKESNKLLLKSLGIDDIVNPEYLVAKELVKLLKQNAATEIFDFSNGLLSLFEIQLDEKALIINQSLCEIIKSHPELNFRTVAIHRDGNTIIPNGDDVFKVGDLACVVTKPEGIPDILRLGGKTNHNINDIIIVGGGRIGRIAAKQLEKEKNFSVKLVDIDKKRCEEELCDNLENTLIINGDARDTELLEDEDIDNTDAYIAVTDDSETNILTCLIAKKYGVKRIMALIENIEYINIAKNIGIDTILNKKYIAASYIVRYTLGKNVRAGKMLSGINAEAIEYIVKPGALISSKQIKNLKFPSGAIIGGITRQNKSFIAKGDFQIEEGDRVVVFTNLTNIHKINKFF